MKIPPSVYGPAVGQAPLQLRAEPEGLGVAERNFSTLDVEESPLPEGAHPAVDRAGADPGLVTDGRASHGDAGRPASGVGLIPGDQEGEKAAVAVQRQVTPRPAGLLPQAAHHLPYPGEGGVPAGEEPGEVVILKLEDTENEDEESYVSVEDEDILNAVFEKFKEKFKDDFNFVD